MSFNLTACVEWWDLSGWAGNHSGKALSPEGTPSIEPSGLLGDFTRMYASPVSHLFRGSEAGLHSSSSFYVCCWIRKTDIGTSAFGSLIGKTINSGDNTVDWRMWTRFGGLNFERRFIDGTQFTITVTGLTTSWNFCEAWIDGADHYVCANRGTPVTTSNAATGQVVDSALRLGARGQATVTSNVDIAQAIIFQRVPSDAEKDALYNGGAGMLYPSLINSSRRRRDQAIYDGSSL